MKATAAFLLLVAFRASPAENSEWARFGSSCGEFKVIGCMTALFTDHPFHIAVGSLAPGNGFAAGPALNFVFHPKPTSSSTEVRSWRLDLASDAVVSDNLSWRAGLYLTARHTREPNVGPLPGVGNPGDFDLRPHSHIFRAYVQSESLNKLSYYGIGQGTSRANLAYYGMTQTIAGINATVPVTKSQDKVDLRLVAEANARFVDLRSDTSDGSYSIEQIYTNASAPGLGGQAAFAQLGGGVLMKSDLTRRLSVDYSIKFQEYASSSSQYSFERLAIDLGHQFAIYSASRPKPPDFNGPDSCINVAHADQGNNAQCPPPSLSKNLEGSVGFRFILNDSFIPSGNAVPFYFQPTLGGGNIDGETFLPSYADYRFRGPNMMLFRGSFEHSLGKLPAGFVFMVDEGRVATTRGGLGFRHLAHSFSTGITLHAGGFPVLSVLFAWGGTEGTHTLAQVNNSLLGGGARPSLY